MIENGKPEYFTEKNGVIFYCEPQKSPARGRGLTRHTAFKHWQLLMRTYYAEDKNNSQ